MVAFLANWQRFFPPSLKDQTIINIYLPGWLARTTFLKEQLAQYQSLHAKTMVRLHPVRPADLERLAGRWRAGRANGDILFAPCRLAQQWAREGLLAEWQGFFDMQFTPDSFLPGFLAGGQAAGKQYLIPLLGHPLLVAARQGAPAYPGLRASASQVAVDPAGYPAPLEQAVALAWSRPPAQTHAWCRQQAARRGLPYLLTPYPGEAAARLGGRVTWSMPAPGQPTVALAEGLVIPKTNRHYAASVAISRQYLVAPGLWKKADWSQQGVPVLELYYRSLGPKHPGPLLGDLRRALPPPAPPAAPPAGTR